MKMVRVLWSRPLKSFLTLGLVLGLSFLGPINITLSEPYPTRPIRLVVGFPPGGAADILGRLAAQQLTLGLGQQVVVDNRGGAGGLLATEIVGHSAANGYTLLFTSIPHVINPHLYKKTTYDALKDFQPIALLATVPLMMVCSPVLPVNQVKQLIAYAKQKPGHLNYASGGNGASSHLAMELFKSMTQVEMNHIPYKGTGPLITDLLSGQVLLTIASVVPLIPHVKSGKLRALGLTGLQRSSLFPDVPTIAETVTGYEVVNWFGVMAPAGISNAIVLQINEKMNQALHQENVKRQLQLQAAEPGSLTVAEFTLRVKNDFYKWQKVIQDSHVVVD